jgi:hypothetical protein
MLNTSMGDENTVETILHLLDTTSHNQEENKI